MKMLMSLLLLLLLLTRLLRMNQTVNNALVKKTEALKRVLFLFEDFAVEDESYDVVREDLLWVRSVVEPEGFRFGGSGFLLISSDLTFLNQ